MLRFLFKSKEKILILFIIFMLILSLAYFYLFHLQEHYRNVQWVEDRCMSELTSVKYQLNVVTEYKNRIDKLLTETQKAHQSDKEVIQEIMENCIAMKQQSIICQNQFEDLQSECKKVREDYDKAIKSLESKTK